MISLVNDGLSANNSILRIVNGSTTRSLLGRFSSVDIPEGSIRIDSSGPYFRCGVEDSFILFIIPYTRESRYFRGIDRGSTTKPDGSFWLVSSGTSPRYAYNGRQYDIFRSGLRNEISGTTLYIYSDSGRTSLVKTVSYSTSVTSTVDVNGGTYYYRLTGSGSDKYEGSFTIYNGFVRVFTGTYSSSSSTQYDCRCNFQSTEFVAGNSTCTEREGVVTDCTDFQLSDGRCGALREGDVCRYENCNTIQVLPGDDDCECDVYICEEVLVSSGSGPTWSVSISYE